MRFAFTFKIKSDKLRRNEPFSEWPDDVRHNAEYTVLLLLNEQIKWLKITL